jgi:hypothetical protein
MLVRVACQQLTRPRPTVVQVGIVLPCEPEPAEKVDRGLGDPSVRLSIAQDSYPSGQLVIVSILRAGDRGVTSSR